MIEVRGVGAKTTYLSFRPGGWRERYNLLDSSGTRTSSISRESTAAFAWSRGDELIRSGETT